MSRTPARLRRSLPFGRRLATTIILIAVLPLLLFGAFSISRIDAALGADADDRIRAALGAVDGVLARRDQDLLETTSAYATWSVTRTLIDEGSVIALQQDILAFLVDQGTVDAAIAIVDGRPLAAGPPAVVATLVAGAGEPKGATSAVITADGDLYQVAVAPVTASDGGPAGWMVFGRRLDAGFAHEVRQLTGFDVAVVLPDGRVSVAGDPAAAAAFTGDLQTADGAGRHDGIAAGWMPAGGGDAPIGRLLVTSRDASIQSLLSQLPAVLLATLLVAASLSIVAAWLLSRSLNLRLASIHDGLAAMAVGRRPIRHSPSDEPDVQRLAVALDDLVAATDRRDRILGDASTAVAGIRPEQGLEVVAQAATDGACSVFGFIRCSLVRADGTVAITSGAAPADTERPGRTVEAPIETAPDAHDWLVGLAPGDRDWTEGDDALFGLYARLISGTLRDARVHEDASDRLTRLGRRNELQREFLRSVSHNLQTPLTTISLLADDLTDPGALGTPDFVSARVAAIRAETDRLERLVAQLLTVSRLDAGRIRLDSDAVAIAPLVGRVWAEIGPDRPFEIDDAAGGLIAVGDREAIEQIVWILLDNAIRYAPTGPIRVRTSVAPGSPTPHILVEIEDEGPGIPEPERAHIFRRFWSGAAGRRRGGTGIGLDIARRLAAAMSGSVSYRPGRPAGSVFVLTLPAEDTRPE